MFTVVTVSKLMLKYRQKIIFDDLNFEIKTQEKIGLIGSNGAGKSSLIKILARKELPDAGEVNFTKNTLTGYLPQDLVIDLNIMGSEYLMENQEFINKLRLDSSGGDSRATSILDATDGWNYEGRLVQLLNDFGCMDLNRKLNTLSGGQVRRLTLAGTLALNPNFLILDEPTNHLDLETIEKLENYLRLYSGALIIVSHDRKFLDNTVTKMWEIIDKRIYEHSGDYTTFLIDKFSRLENHKVLDWKRRQFLKRELKWVRSGVKARAVKDQGRMNRFKELVSKDNLHQEEKLKGNLPNAIRSGSRILEVTNLNLFLNDKNLLKDFTFSFQEWQKIGFIGPNGSGKSTLLRALQNLMLQEIFKTSGTIKVGQNTQFLYLDQHQVELDLDKTPFEFLGHGRDRINFGYGTVSTHKYLQDWLFDGGRANTPIRYLSGGEKSRLSLIKKLTNPTNFLVLDEPTNDLDLDTLRTLEEGLNNLECPILIVSHDRYFLDRVCNTIFSLDKDGGLEIIQGNFSDWAKKHGKMTALRNTDKNSENQTDQDSKKPKADKEQIKADKLKKVRSRELEAQIDKLEIRIMGITLEFNDTELYKNQEKVKELEKKLNGNKRVLAELMFEWENL